MKNHLLLILLLSPLLIFSQAPHSVVDFYQGLPVSESYPIVKKGDSWQSQSRAGEPIPAKVNFTAGTIEIIDEAVGGGTIKTQVKLFRNALGKAVLGIIQEEYDEVGYESSLKFLQNQGEDWTDITKQVMPGGLMEAFFDESWRIFDRKALKFAFDLQYHFAEAGPNVQVVLNFIDFWRICTGMIDKSYPDQMKDLCDMKLPEKMVTMKWVKGQEVFEIQAP